MVDGACVSAVLLLLHQPLNAWTVPGAVTAAAYLFLRDVAGASPGKLAVGLRVVAKDRAPAALWRLPRRNVLLALTPALSAFMTYGMAAVAASLPITLESFYLVARDERIGDRIAGTKVVRRVRS